MDKDEKNSLTIEEQLDIIEKSNNSVLKYFNDIFLHQLEDIQELKTSIFEINVKLDELSKTRDLYTFKSNSKRNAFSPTQADESLGERNKIIDKNIRELLEQKETYSLKLRNLDTTLTSMKKQLQLINSSKDAINSLKHTLIDDETFGFDFVSFDDESSDENLVIHGYNILMQEAFKDAYFNTVLDKDIRESILGINHKLETISYLLRTDMTRANLTLKETIASTRDAVEAINALVSKTDIKLDSDTPLFTLIDDYIMHIRDEHPECIIEIETDFVNEDMKLHPVFVINTMKLISIFFDNIFNHSNANKIDFKVAISDTVLHVKISDNGVGINSDYLNNSPWYSSLHKAHEIIFLLGGSLSVLGSLIGGTDVNFSYPVKK